MLHSKHTAALLDLDTDGAAGELRAALKSRAPLNRGERVGGHMLLRVAFCAKCDGPLYFQKKKDALSRMYYKCIRCGTYVRAGWLESTVEKVLLDNAGEFELTRRRLVPGDDHQAKISELREQVKTLKGIPGTESVIADKEAEIVTLQAAYLLS